MRVIVVLLLMAVALPVHADAGGKRRAVELFAKSADSYRLGRFAEAAQLLRDAYQLFPQPSMLYNLARALEGAGDRPGALDAYRRFLRDEKDIPDRKMIAGRISALEEQLAQEAALKQKAAEQEAAAASAEEARRQAEEARRLDAEHLQIVIAQRRTELERAHLHRDHQRRTIAWSIFGVGAATLVVGGALGGLEVVKRNSINGTTSEIGAASRDATAKNDALGANICFGIGGAIAGAGLIWGIVEAVHQRRHRAERGQVADAR